MTTDTVLRIRRARRAATAAAEWAARLAELEAKQAGR